MITYSRYINSEVHTWYDSSNVIYSKCYDNAGDTVTLKIVFKNGRTYLYKDVAKQDYLSFNTAQSNGDAFNRHIKHYTYLRIMDTDLDELNQLKESYINADRDIDTTPSSELIYRLEVCEKTGEFVLYCGDNPIYRAFEGNVSIINLFRSMNLKYSVEQVDSINVESDEAENHIKVRPFRQPIAIKQEDLCGDSL